MNHFEIFNETNYEVDTKDIENLLNYALDYKKLKNVNFVTLVTLFLHFCYTSKPLV